MTASAELVRLDRFDPRWRIDLRYASARNFAGRILYPTPHAWLRRETAVKLAAAQDQLDRSGWRLKILDAYRPPSAQRALWIAWPDERFVAPPERGSRHTRGAAIDATLVDPEGVELEMPSAYDEFGERAVRGWAGASAAADRNCASLTEALCRAGFETLSSEWWHFDDADWRRYPLLAWEPGPGDAESREVHGAH